MQTVLSKQTETLQQTEQSKLDAAYKATKYNAESTMQQVNQMTSKRLVIAYHHFPADIGKLFRK